MKTASMFLMILLLSSACSKYSKSDIDKQRAELKSIATNINNDFKKIRLEVGILALDVQKLYERQNEILPTIDKSKYAMADNGVFYKTIDDGNSAVFVSGMYPITDEVKNIVYFTEPLDAQFKAIIGKFPEVVQVYYNDKYSYNRIFPFFDVLAQYEPKLDIPAYNFYTSANEKNNPEKKSVWVNEPYVDPAGRGWMVSAIAPTYYNGKFVGVPGIDVTINSITRRYLLENQQSMSLIMDKTGMIVAAQDGTINLFSFPPLFDHKYIETIKQDTYRKESYNLLLSKEEKVRNIANEILKKNNMIIEAEINSEKIIVIAEKIPELNWYLLEILK